MACAKKGKIRVDPAQCGWRKFPSLRTAALKDPNRMFAYRRCSGPSQLLNSVLSIRRHFASHLFKCDHHPSTLLGPSQLFSIFAFFPPLSNLFHLFPPQLNSLHLSPLSSQRLSPLPTSSSSQLFSTLFTSCHLFNSSHLFSPPLHSSHLGQLLSTL